MFVSMPCWVACVEGYKEPEGEARFYLIKTRLIVLTGLPDASSAESPYKASHSTPATYGARKHTQAMLFTRLLCYGVT